MLYIADSRKQDESWHRQLDKSVSYKQFVLRPIKGLGQQEAEHAENIFYDDWHDIMRYLKKFL